MTAVFAGSFDPLTKGHEEIVRRGAELFGNIIVLIAVNPDKKPLLSAEERLSLCRKVFEDDARISVDFTEGYTGDYAIHHGADFLLRGIRDEKDFLYEQNMARQNKELFPSLESVFLPCQPALSEVSSTAVRRALKKKTVCGDFLPEAVADYLRMKFPEYR